MPSFDISSEADLVALKNAVDVAGRQLRCIVYEINPSVVQGKPLIASGDWVRDRFMPLDEK